MRTRLARLNVLAIPAVCAAGLAVCLVISGSTASAAVAAANVAVLLVVARWVTR